MLIVLGVSVNAISTAADKPSFSITISSPPQTWKVGSDVMVEVILTNTSDTTVFFRRAYGQAGERFMDVEVKDDRGNPVPRTKYYRVLRGEDDYDLERQPNGEYTMRMPAGGSVHKKFLKPGETLNDAIIVNRLFDLSRTGKYTICVQRRDEYTKVLVTSNTITVTVSD